MKLRLFYILLWFGTLSYAQDFKIGYSEPAADASPEYRNVVLEIEGLDNTGGAVIPKGILIPSMTLTQRNQIASPPLGLLVFVTDPADVGFYYNTGSGVAVWSKIASGASNSRNGIFTITDPTLSISTSSTVVTFNTEQSNTLEIGKGGQAFIQIPQGAGNANNQPGIAISDDGTFGANPASLVTFTSSNKGVLLPRVTNLSAISNPPFGLMVILQQAAGTSNGVYIQMSSSASSPSWQRITVSP